MFDLASHCGRPGVGVAGGPALVLRRRGPAALAATGTAVRAQPAAAVASRRRPARARESGLPLLAALRSGGVLGPGAAQPCSFISLNHVLGLGILNLLCCVGTRSDRPAPRTSPAQNREPCRTHESCLSSPSMLRGCLRRRLGRRNARAGFVHGFSKPVFAAKLATTGTTSTFEGRKAASTSTLNSSQPPFHF